MPVPAGAIRLGFSYTSDNGTVYNITLEVAVASSGGFEPGTSTQSAWGPLHGRNKVRGVHGVSTDGTQKAFLPCPTQSQLEAIFNAGQWTNPMTGVNYVVTGRRGERFTQTRFTAPS
jgi:hypothetical protein